MQTYANYQSEANASQLLSGREEVSWGGLLRREVERGWKLTGRRINGIRFCILHSPHLHATDRERDSKLLLSARAWRGERRAMCVRVCEWALTMKQNVRRCLCWRWTNSSSSRARDEPPSVEIGKGCGCGEKCGEYRVTLRCSRHSRHTHTQSFHYALQRDDEDKYMYVWQDGGR